MISLFKYSDNDEGFIAVIVRERYVDELKEMGFVGSADEVKKPRKQRSPNKKKEDPKE